MGAAALLRKLLVDGTRLVDQRAINPNRRELAFSGRPMHASAFPPALPANRPMLVGHAHLSGLLSAAVEDGRLPANPAAGLNLPTAAPKPIFYWTQDEAAASLLELGGADALAVELDLYVGLRSGEFFGLRRRYVDLSMGLLHVHGVATRDGWRPCAKTTMSHRAVPIPRHLRPRLAAHVAYLDPDDTVFPAPRGGLWNDRNFARRVFTPAIERAGVSAGTPYDMRHAAASWLVQRGVPLLDVQQLLGHEKYATTLRYAHLKPGEFGSVLDAWGDAPLDPRGPTVTRPTAPQPHDGVGHRKRPRLD
ncbi:tyrosine-type recombinase/integrase [Nocardioides zeae]|uniref:Integrase n=1 Tax=Nocardioides zeae TaxID=1457234 RepID=A0AAJ1X2T9_9ACTN|nr:site-specific integrase [Nocardioides zeae]MDQ1103897.1 integrase [Nocardioides zeae]